ncbi:hypothetical protein [Vibrio sp. OPT18]|uniref:hypothetical protein n=1 Tax=Vibrio sp. OPT18 TaxID=2778641 RepID=UPI0018811E40|nr:hypothetical protein [Vibrio sp. OPT18]MBE8577939.1 hypothetical protein [Vibrio sp. OPT18]
MHDGVYSWSEFTLKRLNSETNGVFWEFAGEVYDIFDELGSLGAPIAFLVIVVPLVLLFLAVKFRN